MVGSWPPTVSPPHPPAAGAPGAQGDLALALVLLLACAGIYRASPIAISYDSMFSLQVAASLIDGDNGELTRYRRLIEAAGGGHLPYQVIERNGRLYSLYPVGTPTLTVPALWAVAALDPVRYARLERAFDLGLEKTVAGAIAATAVAVLYLGIRRRGIGRGAAFLACTAFALGTSHWSTSSMALWQHGALGLSFAWILAALGGDDPTPSELVAAGFAAGFAILVRQTSVLFVAPLFLALLAKTPTLRLGWFAAGTILPLAALIDFNLRSYGELVNPYVHMFRRGFIVQPEALLGLWICPSRGLVVYSPILLAVPWGIAARRAAQGLAPLDLAMLAYVVAHWLVMACWPSWYGGACYGPRMMADVLPFLTLFLAHAFAALETRRARTLCALGLALSIAIHGRGATDIRVWTDWRCPPGVSLEQFVWDWRSPQFLAGL